MKTNITDVTRKNIVESYWEIYKVKEGKQISVKEVMERAGYNRCTFYEYFNDTNDILNYLENSLIEYLKNNIISRNSIDNYILENIPKLYEEKGEYFSVLLGSNGDASFQSKLKNTIKPFIKEKLNVDKQSIKNDLAFEFTISGLISTFNYWYNHRNELDTNELIKITHSIMTKGTIKTIMS